MTATELLRALTNHLWQSSLCFLLAWILARLLRRAPARARFAIWAAASLKWLVPFAALRALGAVIPWRPAALFSPPLQLALALQPFRATRAAVATAAAPPPGAHPHDWAAWALTAWCGGAVALAAPWALRWWRMARAVRAAEPLAGLPLRAVETACALEPGVFGIVRPVLVLPAGFAARMEPEQLAAVVAHEACHIRRHDNLWALLHMAVQAAFWFHPIVWWTGRQMLASREQACDAAVLAAGGDPEAYIQTLLRVCRQTLASPLPCMAGIAGGDLAGRIAAILSDGAGRRLARSARCALWAVGIAVIAAPIAAGLGGGAALAQRRAGIAPLTFSAAVLRVDASSGGVEGGCHGVDSGPQDPRFAVPLGRCVIAGGRLSHMMSIAFNLPMGRISGLPDWDGPSRWAVEAEVENPHTATEAQLLGLLQNFLIKEFQLKLRRETKLASTYLLAVDDAAKLHRASDQEAQTIAPDADGRLHLRAWSMQDLADFLSGIPTVGRPVMDRTHLAGRYDFTLEFLSKPGADSRALKVGLANWQSVVHDVRSELGLKLEPAKSPVRTIVIESATKPTGCPCSQ